MSFFHFSQIDLNSRFFHHFYFYYYLVYFYFIIEDYQHVISSYLIQQADASAGRPKAAGRRHFFASPIGGAIFPELYNNKN